METLDIGIHTSCRSIGAMRQAMQFQFQGQGITPPERVASMQAQLAAFCTTPGFLRPANWHLLQPCLTSLHVSLPTDIETDHPATLLTSPLHMLQVSSLRSLHVDFSTLAAPLPEEQQALVSTLVYLTHLAGTFAGCNGHPLHSFWSHAALLPRLRSIAVAGDPLAGGTFTIPASWSSCSSLTSLDLGTDAARLLVANPASVQGLQQLQSLKLCCAPADLLHLRLLGKLEALSVTCIQPADAAGQQQPLPAAGGAAADDDDDAAAAGAAVVAEAAAAAAAAGSWACSSNLVNLEWLGSCLEAVPLQQLTSLSRLCLGGGDLAAPMPDSLVATLAGLQLLRVLELDAVTLTPELCW
jgi:hypothetical protein